MKKRIDLLQGGILKTLTALAIPIMLTSLVQMAYNMIDMIWIGRISSDAVAAVGAAGMFMWLSNGFVTFARAGGQVLVAQSLGADNKEKAREYANHTIQIAIITGIVFGLVSILFADQLIGFFNLTSVDVINDAKMYLVVTCGLVVFSFINIVYTGILTSMGNSHTSFIATSIGLIVNIVMDPLLIFGLGPIPHMGVLGAAIATVIAQMVVSALLYYSTKDDLVIFSRIKLFEKMSKQTSLEISKIGMPIAIRGILFTSLSMIIARLISGFGDSAIAVQKVGSQIESISWMTAEGFAAAANSFIGQNFGANNMHRAKKGFTYSIILVVFWGIFSSILLIVFPDFIFRIFINDPKILPMGVDYLRILGYSQVFMCVEIVTCGAFAGFGKTFLPSTISIVLTAARIPLAMLLAASVLELNGIWWAITITSVLKGSSLFVLFIVFVRKMSKEQKKSA